MLKEIIDSILEEATGKKREDPKQPICNLSIQLNGWQGAYKDLNHFLRISKKAQTLGVFAGDFTLLKDGTLAYFFKPGLHKYSAEFDLMEINNVTRDFCRTLDGKHYRYFDLPHAYLTSGDRYRLLMVDSIFFEEGTLKFESCPFSRPHYTLDGLYRTLPDQKTSTKIKALRKVLRERRGYSDDSIASRKDTRFKLLEHKYRTMISDQ